MVIGQLSYTTIDHVMRTWELARQKYGFEERVGIDTLVRLFDLEPKTKAIFGFDVNKPVKARGMQRMGLLVHGLRIVHMIDSTMAVAGPDLDEMEGFLSELSERHAKLGVKAEYFPIFVDALTAVLAEILEQEWTEEVGVAWRAFLSPFCIAMAKLESQ